MIYLAGKMTKEGFKHRISETISKFGRGMSAMSCVQSKAFFEDKDYEVLRKRTEIATGREEYDSECLGQNEEKELLDTFQPHRIRRSISFTGFGVHEIERLRRIAEGRDVNGIVSRPESILSESRRSRCHSFGGVKNKKLVEITDGKQETAVVDGLLTTTFCSTDL